MYASSCLSTIAQKTTRGWHALRSWAEKQVRPSSPGPLAVASCRRRSSKSPKGRSGRRMRRRSRDRVLDRAACVGSGRAVPSCRTRGRPAHLWLSSCEPGPRLPHPPRVRPHSGPRSRTPHNGNRTARPPRPALAPARLRRESAIAPKASASRWRSRPTSRPCRVPPSTSYRPHTAPPTSPEVALSSRGRL